jgi:hypothetical protein
MWAFQANDRGAKPGLVWTVTLLKAESEASTIDMVDLLTSALPSNISTCVSEFAGVHSRSPNFRRKKAI